MWCPQVQRGCSRGTSPHGRCALTLIELLVVLAILAVLVGMLLPAVVRVRQAANVAWCKNNLKQIALAASQSHDAYGKLPPPLWFYPGTNAGDGAAFGGPFFHLLPFLEQQNLYQRSYGVNVSQVTAPGFTYTGYHCHLILLEVVKVYLCPSDPSVVDGLTQVRGYGATSYGANFQVLGNPALPHPTGWVNHTRIASITDGTAQTILFAEKYGGCPRGSAFLGRNGSVWANNATDGYSPLFAVTTPGQNYDHAVPAPAMFQTRPTPWATACHSALAITPHTAMNAAFVDGHVDGLSPRINPATVWWPLLTPASGDISDY